MGGNTGEIQLGSERKLYKQVQVLELYYIVQMHKIFRLLRGVPDYSSSESFREKQKLVGFIVIISQRGVCKYISLSAFAPENLVSRFSRPAPRQPAHPHTQAEPGAYFRESSRVPRRRPYIDSKSPYVIRSVPSLSGHAINCLPMVSLPRVRRHRASTKSRR